MGLGMSMTDRLLSSMGTRPFEWPSDLYAMILGGGVGIGTLAGFRRWSHARAVARAMTMQAWAPPKPPMFPGYAIAGGVGAFGGTLVNGMRIALPPGWTRLTD